MTNSPKTPCAKCGATLKREDVYFTQHLANPSPGEETELSRALGNDITMCFECHYGFILWLGPYMEAQIEALNQIIETEGEPTEPIPGEVLRKRANAILESRTQI